MTDYITNTIQLHIAKNKDGEFFHLILKRSPEKYPYPNIWQVVTGNIENNEKAINTAVRELFEETGLTYKRIMTVPYVSSFFDTLKNSVCHVPVFGVLITGDDKIKLSNEHTEFRWLKAGDCISRLALPSHREGTKIFQEFILDDINSRIFDINLDNI